MTALLPPSRARGFGAAARWKRGREHVPFAEHSGCKRERGVHVRACVFTPHANSDVPIAAQTSCCCWRSSQKLFSSVVKFNFNVLLCRRMCSLPSCRGGPSSVVVAVCRHPRAKAELQISPVSSDTFHEESASLAPSTPLSLLPLSLDNAIPLQTEILSPDLSLSLKACVVKFLKPEISNRRTKAAGSVRQEAGACAGFCLGSAQGAEPWGVRSLPSHLMH